LVLVVPVELAGSRGGEEGAEPEQAAPLTGEVPRLLHTEGEGAAGATPPAAQPGPAQQEGAEPAEEEGGFTEAAPHPVPGGKKAAGPTTKLKKVISRKKAGKQERTIVVTVPKEEAEMVDLGAKPKKRGRPRKTPSVDPPDPHKGSVLDPKEGVCADPVNRGAILERGEPDPHSRDRTRQLAPDKGSGKT
jgi:hypothetical protein